MPDIFSRFRSYRGPVPAGIRCGWLGDMYRPEWHGLESPAADPCFEPPAPAPDHQDYLEWLSVLESVASARDQFTMLELGAGWGAWGMRGALAAFQAGIPTANIHIKFVEAEPHHAIWIREAIALNPAVHGAQIKLIEAAVASTDGIVHFATGHEREWYGQQITTPGTDYSQWGFGEAKIMPVPAVSLATLIDDLPAIDLIDMDIQGAEADVIEAAIPVLDRVKRLHIETHNAEVEVRLRAALEQAGFRPIWDFPCYQSSDTPFGRMTFDGGVQAWVRP